MLPGARKVSFNVLCFLNFLNILMCRSQHGRNEKPLDENFPRHSL
jgi:hypothetical protein